MKVTVESSRLVKPTYEGDPPIPVTDYIPLNVFDKVNFNTYQGLIFAYPHSLPTNTTFEIGLKKVLSVYRAFGGRLGKNGKNEPAILLNDKGARFVEAFVDSNLSQVFPSQPSPALLSLHPSTDGIEELLLVQITRFTCGSMVVTSTSHHFLGDGEATSNFLVAWCEACRGLNISRLPSTDRRVPPPRDPPIYEFDHKNNEFMSENLGDITRYHQNSKNRDEIVVGKVHFTRKFLAILKDKAASSLTGNGKPYSTLVCLLAHLWRVIAKARSLPGTETTHMRIAVNGRRRLNPRVHDNYSGNLVLWAFPRTVVKDLIGKPLSFTAELIHSAISQVNNNYFRSFIDFANNKVEGEQLVPTADPDVMVMSPNLEVDSLLSFPFHELDFGGGCPFIFMPSYLPIEGVIFLSPSIIPSGGIDAFIPLFKNDMVFFDQNCYSADELFPSNI